MAKLVISPAAGKYLKKVKDKKLKSLFRMISDKDLDEFKKERKRS